MKRHLFLLTIFLSLALLVACGPSNTEPESTATAVSPTDDPSPIRPTATNTGTEAYPAAPTPQTQTESYPQPLAQPTTNPYPSAVTSEDGKTWMVMAAGRQCTEPLTYPDVTDAVKSLEDAGITVHDSQTVEVGVLAVCGGPTSTQYLALVDSEKANDAEKLGWLFAE